MTHITPKIATACAALLIVSVTWAPLINIPSAHASVTLSVPALA